MTCEVDYNCKSHRVEEDEGMAVSIVLQVRHPLEHVFQLEGPAKAAEAALPEELDQCKHQVSKCMEVTAVQQHASEAVRESSLEVAAKKDPLTIPADTTYKSRAHVCEQVVYDAEAIRI